MVLRAAYQRLRMTKEHDEALLRVRDNPATTLVPRGEGDVEQFIDTTRMLLTSLMQRQ